MYAFVDRPLKSLDPGCRFLVWSMRAWVSLLGQKTCHARSLAPAFTKWRMLAALQPFHRAMLLFNRDGLETVAFCALQCDHVSEHEAIILALVLQVREQGLTDARATLERLVADESVGDLLQAIVQVGAAMAVAGIFPQVPAVARD